MATRKPSNEIRISTDERPALEGLKNLVEGFVEASTKINNATDLVGKAWGLVTGAIDTAISLTSEYVELANVQVEAEDRLADALSLRGELTDLGVASLKAYAAGLQRTTAIGDEATLHLMSQLSALGIQRDALEESARAAIGLAEVTGSLESATKLVARAQHGHVEGLKRYGIEVEDTAEAMDRFRSFFVFAEVDTFAGRVTQLGNAVGDLKEELGRGIVENESLNKALGDLKLVAEQATDAVRDLGLIDQGVTFFGGVVSGVSSFVSAGLAAIDVARDLARELATLEGPGPAQGARAGLQGDVDRSLGSGGVALRDALRREVTDAVSSPGTTLARNLPVIGPGIQGAEAFVDAFRGLAEQREVERREAAENAQVAAKLRALIEESSKPAVDVEDGERGDFAELARRLASPKGRAFGAGREGTRTDPRAPEADTATLGPAADAGERAAFGSSDVFRMLEEQEKAQTAIEDLRRRERESRSDFDRFQVEARDKAFDLEVEDFDRREEQRARQLASESAYWQRIGSIGLQGATMFVSGLTEALTSDDPSRAVRELGAQVLKAIGGQLFAMGLAAVAAGTLGTVAPIFAPATGGPAGVAAGVALSAIGLGLMTGGALLGKGSRGGASTGTTRSAPSSGRGSSSPDPARDFRIPGQAAADPYTVNVVFNGPVGDPRRIARELVDVLGQGGYQLQRART